MALLGILILHDLGPNFSRFCIKYRAASLVRPQTCISYASGFTWVAGAWFLQVVANVALLGSILYICFVSEIALTIKPLLKSALRSNFVNCKLLLPIVANGILLDGIIYAFTIFV